MAGVIRLEVDETAWLSATRSRYTLFTLALVDPPGQLLDVEPDRTALRQVACRRHER